MWYALAALGVLAVVVLVYWFGFRKPEELALPEAEEPKKLLAGPEIKTKKTASSTGGTAGDRKPQKKREEEKPKPKPEPKKELAKEPEKADAKVEADRPKEKEPDDRVEAQTGHKTEETDHASKVGAEPAAQEAEAKKVGTAPQVPEPEPIVGKSVDPQSASSRARDVEGLRKGLGKSRAKEGFFGKLANLIIRRKEIDPDIIDEMEEILITSDVGVQTTEAILGRIRRGMNNNELDDSAKVWAALRQEAVRILSVGPGGLTLSTKPTVVLMVGVNGSGKTTTIGKLATQIKATGRDVLLAAGDTFRAAAVQQLQVWGRRVGCEVVRGKDGADPGAVIFDAIRNGAERGADVVLADTAGRLHTKSNLMDELVKVKKTMGKAMEGAPHEILLVIDATNGQNALAQSRQFAEAMPLTGIVLTKLDGTAKGGVILGICDELKVPVRYVGIGEKSDDLRPFDAEEFVEALLGSSESEDIEAA